MALSKVITPESCKPDAAAIVARYKSNRIRYLGRAKFGYPRFVARERGPDLEVPSCVVQKVAAATPREDYERTRRRELGPTELPSAETDHTLHNSWAGQVHPKL